MAASVSVEGLSTNPPAPAPVAPAAAPAAPAAAEAEAEAIEAEEDAAGVGGRSGATER